MLLQMPILISFFTVFRSTIEFRGAPFFGWITDLSAPDTLFTVAGFPINILPFLMGITMFLQQKLMAVPGSGGQQKMMMYFMNVFFLFLFYTFPSGLNLYYSVFNPEIIEYSKETTYFKESCLSYPGLKIAIRRSESIKAQFEVKDGSTKGAVFNGLSSRIFQHEMEHVRGREYFWEVSNFILKQAMKKRKHNLKKMRRDV